LIKINAIRLHPGQDLLQALETFAAENNILAGFILTCVGSLRQANLRLSDQEDESFYERTFEIVSLVGTLGPDGSHLHISLSDSDGRTIGGHLLPGCLIYTTAEIVLGDLDDLVFRRPIDPQTTYDELDPQPRAG
jgi:uncharacterized protein